MRLKALAVASAVLASLTLTQVAQAKPGVDIEAPVAVDGTGPASVQRGYCAGNEEFPIHHYERTSPVRNEDKEVRFDINGNIVDIIGTIRVIFGGPPPSDSFKIAEVMVHAWCENDEGEIDETTRFEDWVPLPDPSLPVPDLLEYVRANLIPPTVTFPDRSPEHGWLYVNVPMDVRIDELSTVRSELTLSNVLATATGWVEATPSYVVFDSGEPDGTPLVCTYAEAVAPYRADAPGACSYTYTYSSGVSPSGTFPTSVTVGWEITSSAPATINNSLSTSSEDVAVAEFQAIVVDG